MKRYRKSIIIPLMLLIYLAVMAYFGRDNLASGNYLEYFGILVVSLLCIAGLYFTLRTQEKIRARKQKELDDLTNSSDTPSNNDENNTTKPTA